MNELFAVAKAAVATELAERPERVEVVGVELRPDDRYAEVGGSVNYLTVTLRIETRVPRKE